ncbi:hypothetical protein KQI74_03060 [Paenibacillus barcinonensis]|jgi:hypothetical protein|uniref:hypothetical protein n=1 Tax=Paenibacillus TaxID=44249 RepID=UPI001C11CB17|nr:MULTISPECIES: hypothetical protein [Paenibacillus]MBU5351244.1 hypothetical protein [Paenibacillus barcinonensis]MDM5278132.1 hypothetical protein [Paenibacillus silvae]
MNVDDQLELLKYQIKLIRTVVASDEHPYFMFLLDHDFNEKQTRSLNDVLYIFNRRLGRHSAESDEQSKLFHSEKVKDIMERNKFFGVPDDFLLSDSPPTYKEFISIIKLIAPVDVNPSYLLKSLKMQEMYVDLCEYLLGQE